MKRILTAVVLIPVVLLILFRAPLWLFAAAVALVAFLAMREYLDIIQHYGSKPFRKIALLASVLTCGLPAAVSVIDAAARRENYSMMPLWIMHQSAYVINALLLTLPLWLLALALRRTNFKQAVPDAALTAFGYTYVAIPLSFLLQIRATRDGASLIVFLFAAVWVGDAAAYYIGKNFGRHLLAPTLSPKKTWEGSIASVLGSIAIACALLWSQPWIIAHWLFSPHAFTKVPVLGPANRFAAFATAILLAIAINIAAQLGDLVESMLKRGAGIKDSGAILPGHGGMLDRIDALLLAAPVLYIYVMIAGASVVFQPIVIP